MESTVGLLLVDVFTAKLEGMELKLKIFRSLSQLSKCKLDFMHYHTK